MSTTFFQNLECEYFPCHGSPTQNCLFCYCPLYFLGDKCGGDYTVLPNGIKDCSHCLKPHEDYPWIIEQITKHNKMFAGSKN